MKNELYYYSISTPKEKQAYRIMYEGLQKRHFEIIVEMDLELSQIQELYIKVLYDNPLFFYVNQQVIRVLGEKGYWLLMPEYLCGEREIIELTKEVHHVIKKVVLDAHKNVNNPFQLEKYLHDVVVKSVAYDYDALRKSDCYNAHSIIGAFLDKKAVCEGISKAFKLLCNEFHFKCIVVLGQANIDGNYGEDDYHAWNLIKTGDESYHVDVTWDNLYDTTLRHISYDYFNLTTKDILIDHLPLDTENLPICNSTQLNYFHSTNSFVSNYEQLVELVNNRFASKKIMFKFKNDEGEFPSVNAVKDKLLSAIQEVNMVRGTKFSFYIVFNERHNIAKMIVEK